MYLNLASYLFTNLEHPACLRQEILQAGLRLSMRGTVLLATEGINVFVCGPEAQAREFAAHLRTDARFGGHFATLEFKRSWSAIQSFNRLLVKVKKEIITFRRPQYQPARARAATVAPEALARWLDRGSDDDGRAVVMVDTRNAFEVQVGTFAGAIDPGLNAFTELPAALERHRAALAGKRIVTFCTGGIRCEKAALHLTACGLENVVQLDGGVLKYFEEIGSRHWEGELFVFDKRVSLKPDLQPGTWEQDCGSRQIRPGRVA